MKIVDYFEYINKKDILKQIKECDWRAAKFLYDLLLNKKFKDTLGDNATLFVMLDENNNLVSFISLSDRDCIDDPTKTCWVGFIYTIPKYRGNRYSEKMINYACERAKEKGNKIVYVGTNRIGLYEKYGFTYLENNMDIYGENSRIYYKLLK